MQVLLLCGRRTYDRSIAGLGTGKAQRYFASDFDRFSNRLFDARHIGAVEVVSRQREAQAVRHALSQCSNAVLDRGRIDEGKLREEARTVSTS
jgi:hypothetical protein